VLRKYIVGSPVIIIAIVIARSFHAVVLTLQESLNRLKKRQVASVFFSLNYIV